MLAEEPSCLAEKAFCLAQRPLVLPFFNHVHSLLIFSLCNNIMKILVYNILLFIIIMYMFVMIHT